VFETVDALKVQFGGLRKARRLHAVTKGRLATLLGEIYPGGCPVPEPGEMAGGRADLCFYLPSAYAVFEIFATLGQVAQDLRHLEQSRAEVRIAVLPDPELDPFISREYFRKKPRGPFPHLWLSQVLVTSNAEATRLQLRELIEKGLAASARHASVWEVSRRLVQLHLAQVTDALFGANEHTRGVVSPGLPSVVLAALPESGPASAPTEVLRTAQQMLELRKWYAAADPDALPPKYWPRSIFEVPKQSRSGLEAMAWEDVKAGTGATLARLVITSGAEVLFCSSALFVRHAKNGATVFRLGPILAECWKLSGLVAQLEQDLGYRSGIRMCVAMVGTQESHLGDFADGWPDPLYDANGQYWLTVTIDGFDWSCNSPNLVFCETINVTEMEPKTQPLFVSSLAEAISLAYNHQEPRCFDKSNGKLLDRYFRRFYA
jgi:hypothetical protein